jgi:aspartyl-tRNA synthetase
MKRVLIKKTLEKVGQEVRVCGWASKIRDHGSLIFVDLRDWSGKVQLVLDVNSIKSAEKIGSEYVLEVTGLVKEREEKLKNNALETGNIEIEVKELKILNESKTPPFPLDSNGEEIEEQVRLKYRYIDIRRERVRNLIENRDKLMFLTREWFRENGFTEVQTPLLTVSSPEGARDYLVPSRIHQGKFYALPQAPQQYKQLLMVGGLDKYFQIAPCFRDEDPRADRHSGDFYQIDAECSFVTKEEFFNLVEPYFKKSVQELTEKRIKEETILQIPYEEVLDKYGTDKPDLRYEMFLTDLTEEFKNSDMDIFKKVETVKAVLIDRVFSKKEVDNLTEEFKRQGAGGLAYLTIEGSSFGGPLTKFFDEKVQGEILERFKERGYTVKGEQTIFALAGGSKKTIELAGLLRSRMGDILDLKDPNVLAIAWIIDFPMFEWNEDLKKWDFGHNPFSMPQGGIKALRENDPKDMLAEQYDLVCNGYELGSGSIRNFHPESFIKAFEIVGYSEEETRKEFGHMISAFEYGAPPHGGFAVGFDRYMMILFDEENIREVYAFPKSNAQELMTGAPREIREEELSILGLQFKKKK